MATNAELLDTHANRKVLRAELERLRAEIAPTLARVKELEAQLDAASEITDVVDGLCLSVMRDREGRWEDARCVSTDLGAGPCSSCSSVQAEGLNTLGCEC
jgi:hypothetical protein